MLVVVIALGLAAALLYALSDFLEQRAAQRAARRAREAAEAAKEEPNASRWHRGAASLRAGLRRLLHDRLWFAGWVLGTLAYLVQAVALHLGSVGIVQALQVTTLVFAIPLSTVGRRERPTVRDLLAAASICLGLAMLLVARGEPTARPDRPRLVWVLAVVAVLVAALCLAAWRRHGPLRAALLAVAAGATYGASATMVKLTGLDLTNNGIAATAADWPGYALAVLAIGSVVLQQAAFAAARLPTATTAIVVTNPLVASVAAVIGFREPLPSDPLQLALLGACAFPLVAGLVVLPRSPLLRTPDEAAH